MAKPCSLCGADLIPSCCGCLNPACKNHVDKWKIATAGYEPPIEVKPAPVPKAVVAPAPVAEAPKSEFPKVDFFVKYFGGKKETNPNNQSWAAGFEFATKWEASTATEMLKEIDQVDKSFLDGSAWYEMTLSVKYWAKKESPVATGEVKKRGRPKKIKDPE